MTELEYLPMAFFINSMPSSHAVAVTLFHSDQTWVFAGEFIWGVWGVQAKFGEYTGSTDQIWGVFGEYRPNLGSFWGVQTKFEVYADNITKICCKVVIYHVFD